MSASLTQLLGVPSRQAGAVIQYLRALEAEMAKSPILNQVGRRLDDTLRIPLDCHPHDTARVAAELKEREHLRMDGRAVKDTILYSQRHDGTLYADEPRLRLEATQPKSLDTVDTNQTSLVILGDPGSGKTEWSRHTAARAAGALRRRLELAETLVEQVGLPVWLTFNEFAKALRRTTADKREFYETFLRGDHRNTSAAAGAIPPWPELTDDDHVFVALTLAVYNQPLLETLRTREDKSLVLRQLWHGWIHPAEPSPPSPSPSTATLPFDTSFLSRMAKWDVAKKDPCDRILCLDAWDEVRAEDDRQPLVHMLGVLRRRSAEVHGCLRVSSRLTAYDGALGDPKDTVDILPLPVAKTRDFLRTFLNDPELFRQVEMQLENNSSLGELLTNPLLLTLHAISMMSLPEAGKTATLPRGRCDVLAGVFRVLLGPEEDRRKQRVIPLDSNLMVSQKLTQLREIAWHLWPQSLFTVKELDDSCETLSPGKALAQEMKARNSSLYQLLTGNNPVLVAHGDAFRFLHLTLQEYLVAEYLAEKINHQGWNRARVEWAEEGGARRETPLADLIDCKSWLQAWRQVVVMLAGLLKDPLPLLECLTRRAMDTTGIRGYTQTAYEKNDRLASVILRLLPENSPLATDLLKSDLLGHRATLAAFACSEVPQEWWRAREDGRKWLKKFGEALYRWWTAAHDVLTQFDLSWVRIPMGIVASVQGTIGMDSIKEAVIAGITQFGQNDGLKHLLTSMDWMATYPKDAPWDRVDSQRLLDFACGGSGKPRPYAFEEAEDHALRQSALSMFDKAPESFWLRLPLIGSLDLTDKGAAEFFSKAPASFWQRATSEEVEIWLARIRERPDYVSLLKSAHRAFLDRMSGRNYMLLLQHPEAEVRFFAIELLESESPLWDLVEPNELFGLLTSDDELESLYPSWRDHRLGTKVASVLKHDAPASFWKRIDQPREMLWSTLRDDARRIDSIAEVVIGVPVPIASDKQVIAGHITADSILNLMQSGGTTQWAECRAALQQYSHRRLATTLRRTLPDTQASKKLCAGATDGFLNGNDLTRRRALEILGYAEDQYWQELDTNVFIGCLESEDEETRIAAVTGLRSITEDQWASVSEETIRRLLDDENTREFAAYALCSAPDVVISRFNVQETIVFFYGSDVWPGQRFEELFFRRFVPRMTVAERYALLDHSSPTVRQVAILIALAGGFTEPDECIEMEKKKKFLRCLDDPDSDVRAMAQCLLQSEPTQFRAGRNYFCQKNGIWDAVELEDLVRWMGDPVPENARTITSTYFKMLGETERHRQRDGNQMTAPPFSVSMFLQRCHGAGEDVRDTLISELECDHLDLADLRPYLNDVSETVRYNTWWKLQDAPKHLVEQLEAQDIQIGLSDRHNATCGFVMNAFQRATASVLQAFPLKDFLGLLMDDDHGIRVEAWKCVVRLASDHGLRILTDHCSDSTRLVSVKQLAKLPLPIWRKIWPAVFAK